MSPRSIVKFFSFLLVCSGLFLATSAVLPILRYEVFSQEIKEDFISPVSKVYEVPENDKDLVHASNWFVGKPNLSEMDYKVRFYRLSIPRLKVQDASVEIGGDDLSRSLIQYGGTTIPGRVGNAIVFGHSTVPQLYNPKNYLTIFSMLPSLKKGDDVIVDYDGITYNFKVGQMVEVGPEDIQVLEQRYDNAYLSLVTCVPPGTTLRRLVVRAKLVPAQGTI